MERALKVKAEGAREALSVAALPFTTFSVVNRFWQVLANPRAQKHECRKLWLCGVEVALDVL